MSDHTGVGYGGRMDAPRRPAQWVPRERLLAALIQADPGLRQDLAEALPDTVDDIPGVDVVRV